jgi:hypothetical protein
MLATPKGSGEDRLEVKASPEWGTVEWISVVNRWYTRLY